MWITSAKTRLAIVGAIAAAVFGSYASPSAASEETLRREPATAVAAPPPDEMMKVTGTIEAVEENFFGYAIQVRIISDMGAFLIAKAGKGEELTGHVGETVTLLAHRTTDEQGNTVLSVEGYRVHEG